MTNPDDFIAATLKACGDRQISEGGLTKREYFAAMALQGILANIGDGEHRESAFMAVESADALIVELNK